MSAATGRSWGLLRPGLLADLQLPSAAAFAARFGVGVDHARAALAREVAPSDDLVAALLRFYLVLPPLYFLEPHLI